MFDDRAQRRAAAAVVARRAEELARWARTHGAEVTRCRQVHAALGATLRAAGVTETEAGFAPLSSADLLAISAALEAGGAHRITGSPVPVGRSDAPLGGWETRTFAVRFAITPPADLFSKPGVAATLVASDGEREWEVRSPAALLAPASVVTAA